MAYVLICLIGYLLGCSNLAAYLAKWKHVDLKSRGSHALMLEVRVSNDPAIALYEKLGFRLVGRRKNYYRNPKEDALILRKEWEN